jgi:hypothetical protein
VCGLWRKGRLDLCGREDLGFRNIEVSPMELFVKKRISQPCCSQRSYWCITCVFVSPLKSQREGKILKKEEGEGCLGDHLFSRGLEERVCVWL